MPAARHLHNSTAYEPLFMFPTSELIEQVSESQKVWSNIQQNVTDNKNSLVHNHSHVDPLQYGSMHAHSLA